jgi:hypothetical protein
MTLQTPGPVKDVLLPTGLTSDEARSRLEKFGPDTVADTDVHPLQRALHRPRSATTSPSNSQSALLTASRCLRAKKEEPIFHTPEMDRHFERIRNRAGVRAVYERLAPLSCWPVIIPVFQALLSGNGFQGNGSQGLIRLLLHSRRSQAERSEETGGGVRSGG